jgi:hypothetical protein
MHGQLNIKKNLSSLFWSPHITMSARIILKGQMWEKIVSNFAIGIQLPVVYDNVFAYVGSHYPVC